MQLSCHIKLLALEELDSSQLFFSNYLQMFKIKPETAREDPAECTATQFAGLTGKCLQTSSVAASGWEMGSCCKDHSLRSLH